MSGNHPERQRLKKDAVNLIKQALEAQGFRVKKNENRVEGCCPTTGVLICQFNWVPSDKGTQPGGWCFQLALTDCFSVRDLKTAVREASRVRQIRRKCWDAWRDFISSRSDRRWAGYRGHQAALFLRQDLSDDEDE